MADAGYGSEPSYTFIESPSKQVLIPYTKYEKNRLVNIKIIRQKYKIGIMILE